MAVTSLPSVTDGDMVIKQYNTLTINSGNVLTVSNRCRGLFIYVKGDCVINGQISMDSRGPYVNPTSQPSNSSDGLAVSSNGLRYHYIPTDNVGDSITLDGTTFNGAGNAIRNAIANIGYLEHSTYVDLQRQGANGGRSDGATGGSGASTRQSGGGGAGNREAGGRGGYGNHGSCFGGGSGGGGARNTTGGDATVWGGPGGNGTRSCGGCGTGGGAGNPGGAGANAGGGGSGTGGLVFLVVGGDLNIGSTGSIVARGATGGAAYCGGHCGEWRGGGGSGGGNIVVLYRGNYNVSPSAVISAAGGGGGPGSGGSGGAGGAGSVQIRKIK